MAVYAGNVWELPNLSELRHTVCFFMFSHKRKKRSLLLEESLKNSVILRRSGCHLLGIVRDCRSHLEESETSHPDTIFVCVCQNIGRKEVVSALADGFVSAQKQNNKALVFKYSCVLLAAWQGAMMLACCCHYSSWAAASITLPHSFLLTGFFLLFILFLHPLLLFLIAKAMSFPKSPASK